jgi:hypothetical protein
MDPLHLCIAILPLAIYLLAIAFVNFRGRPVVVSGYRDGMLLGLGVLGLAIAGPLELFLPESAAFRIGWYVWPLLVVLYLLLVLLTVLMSRPRLVVYNLDSDELRPLLSEVVRSMDPQSRWAGDSLAMPTKGLQLYIERNPNMRTVELVGSATDQDLQSLAQLEKNLKRVVKQDQPANHSARVARSGAAPQLMLVSAIMMLIIFTISIVRDHQAILAGLQEMLRL